VVLALLLLVGIGLQVFNPQIMRRFIDAALLGNPPDELLIPSVVFIGIALLQQLVSVAATYLGENVAWTATNALRVDLARHCLLLDMGFHNEHRPGEFIERIDGDVAELAVFFSRLVLEVGANLVLLFGILIALFLEEWRLAGILTVFVVVTLLILHRTRSLTRPHVKRVRQSYADLFGFLEERLGGTEDIRSSGAIGYVLRGLYRLQHNVLRRSLKSHRMVVYVHSAANLMRLVGNVIAIVAGYVLYREGAITLGTAYLYVHYVNLLNRPLGGLNYQIQAMQQVGANLERLEELLRTRSRVPDGLGPPIPSGPISVALEDISFAYVPGRPVLRDLSFALEPGEVVGLLGRSGSGKTTVARLIFRLYDPSAGRVTLNGADIRNTALGGLRDRVGIVTQDVQLFEASVRDNLTFFDESVPDEHILEAIEQLGLSNWLHSLPKGLDTSLGTGGYGLSAGEAQLLAFARVFLRDPGLVILDEAASRLDPATERRIERAVDRLLRDRTAIVIAHRLSTVRRADRIVILEDGHVVESGEQVQLALDPTSRFFELLRTGVEVERP
jgi:ATP-binding cassette subfamily B protein